MNSTSVSGTNGTYNSTYATGFAKNHEHLLPKSVDEIEASVKAIVAYKRKHPKEKDAGEIRILDYGCGPGRYLSIYEVLAQRYPDFIFRYVGYDPYEKQLEQFENRLQKHHFSLSPGSERLQNITISAGGCQGPHYQKGKNLLVELIVGDKEDNAARVEKLLPKQTDLTLCLFTVLSHIPGGKSRNSVLKIFDKITNFAVHVSVPNKIGKENELQLYDGLRQKLPEDPQIVGLLGPATEPGDIRYISPPRKIELDAAGQKPTADDYNFMHIFSAENIANEFKNAAFPAFRISCSNQVAEHELANTKLAPAPKSRWKKRLDLHTAPSLGTNAHLARLDDAEASRAMIPYDSDKTADSEHILAELNDKARYFWVTAIPSQGKDRGLKVDDFCGKAPKQSAHVSR